MTQEQYNRAVEISERLYELDEAPQAYKPMQSIIDAIGSTVTIKKIIKPIYNFKAK